MFLFIGILFFVIGVISAFVPVLRKGNTYIISFLLGVGVICLHVFGPFLNKDSKLKALLNIDDSSVVEFNIYPDDNSNVRQLVKSRKLIGNQVAISEFTHAIKKGSISSDMNKNPLWSCKIELLKDNQDVLWLSISKQGETTLLILMSGRYGWHLGTIRADELGVFLENIAQ